MSPRQLKQIMRQLGYGLDSRAFADLIGVTPGTVWRWETGKVDVPYPKCLLIQLLALDKKNLNFAKRHRQR